jgi:hypothetical protein
MTAEAIQVDGPDEALELFWSRGWTDGLPIVPPTPERVKQFLDYAGVSAETLVGTMPERNRAFTAEHVAINAVMAGCLPEYFAVVLAAWQAMCSPEYCLDQAATSTSGAAPLLIVNGPIAKRIGMRSQGNVLGPGNRANATIGRAVRLLLINLVGASGDLDKSCIGHPGKYTYCLAEDEDGAWPSLSSERGFSSDVSAVTVVHCEGPQNVREDSAHTPEEMLENFADHVCNWNQGGVGIILMNPEHRAIAQAANWSKLEVANFLYHRSARTVAELKRVFRMHGKVEVGDEERLHRWARSPADFMIVGAGSVGMFSAVIPPWAGGVLSEPVTRLVADPGCAGECFL